MEKKDKKLRKKRRVRVSTVYAISFLSLSSLIVRLAYVQVAQGPSFRKAESTSQFIKVPVMPQRGWIYDANGKVLAWDTPSDEIVVDNFAGNTKKQDMQIANILAPVLNKKAQDIYNTIETDKQHLQIPIATHVTKAQSAFVVEHQSQLPNVRLVQNYVRQYPEGDLAGQVLGYVGSITAQNVAHYHKLGYLDSQRVGVSGLEYQYESLLQGKPGTKLLMINGNDAKTVGYAPNPTSGDNIQLTLDGHLQAQAQNIVQQMISKSPQKSQITEASAVVLNTHTGGVLAMVSYPYLNPNWYTSGQPLDKKQVQYLNSSGAQSNFAIQSPEYPGSTVKPANFVTAFRHGVMNKNTIVDDRGFIRIGASIIHEDMSIAFGPVDPVRAVAVSSDVFFYTMGLRLANWYGSTSTSGGSYPAKDGSYQNYLDTDYVKGVNALFQGEWDFGLGPKTGIDLPNEAAGRFYIENAQNHYYETPYDLKKAEAAIKKTGKYVTHGTPEDLAFGSIGQSQQFTTMQLATYAMNLANSGHKLKPHLLSQVYPASATPNGGGKPIKTVQPISEGTVPAKASTFNLLRSAMEDVTTGKVGGNYATAVGLFTSAPYPVAAKTGTAQITLHGKRTLNSVFICYAPANNPQVAMAIMIPGGGYGASLSGPIARQIFDAYFNEHHESFMPKKGWTNTNIPTTWAKSPANTLPQ